ncbi:MAG: Gfo/Idh/MocA family oxidoreductase [Clostridia bacterium]|nr:Gfo/Idh/MocA family oxidoreductase [Clostridia bacterium]
MKVIHVGLGDFGYSWFHDVLQKDERIEIIGLVDQNIKEIREQKDFPGLADAVFFESIPEALETLRPDFIINATPPKVHKTIDMLALKAGIPVLSEKPIAESLPDAADILSASRQYATPLMIAENYRYMEIARRAKHLLESGAIGPIHSVTVDFFRSHHMTNYLKDLKHPLLLDVSIHHFDVLRYLTSAEVKEVFATSWNPSWSWYKGLPCLNASLEMESEIKVSYRGSLCSPVNSTGWFGNWRIEGSLGGYGAL